LTLGLCIWPAAAQAPDDTSAPAPASESPSDGASPNPDTANDKPQVAAAPKDQPPIGGVFFHQIALFNIAEIKAGELAEDRANGAKVAILASMVIADHEALAPDILRLANKKHINLPTQLDARNRSVVKRLEASKPNDFDGIYLRQLISDQKTAIGLMEVEARSTKNIDKKEFIVATLPILRKHADDAAEILKESTDQH
jgi:putative membrane protein